MEVRGQHPGPSAVSTRRRCDCQVATWLRKPQNRLRVALVILVILAYYLTTVILLFVGDSEATEILGWVGIVVGPLTFVTQLVLIACAGLDRERESRSKVIWILVIFFAAPVGIPIYWWMAVR